MILRGRFELPNLFSLSLMTLLQGIPHLVCYIYYSLMAMTNYINNNLHAFHFFVVYWLWPFFVFCSVSFFSISNKSSVISFFFYLIEQLNANDQRTRHVAILTNQKLGHINQSEIGT